MRYLDDVSYVNQSMIDRGLARAVPYMLRIDRFFTDEEKAANLALAECTKMSGNSDEWKKHCDETSARIADEVYQLVMEIEKRYSIGQLNRAYDYRDGKNEDFWFWCNTKDGKRDYSYVTLSFWKDRSAEEKDAIVDELKRFFDGYHARNIQVYIQYDTEMNESACKLEAERIYNDNKGKFVAYGFQQGRLFKDENSGEYYFRRKNAKKAYYKMSIDAVCNCAAC